MSKNYLLINKVKYCYLIFQLSEYIGCANNCGIIIIVLVVGKDITYRSMHGTMEDDVLLKDVCVLILLCCYNF